MSYKLDLNAYRESVYFWTIFDTLFETPVETNGGFPIKLVFDPQITEWIADTTISTPVLRWENFESGIVLEFETEQDRLLFRLRWL